MYYTLSARKEKTNSFQLDTHINNVKVDKGYSRKDGSTNYDGVATIVISFILLMLSVSEDEDIF